MPAFPASEHDNTRTHLPIRNMLPIGFVKLLTVHCRDSKHLLLEMKIHETPLNASIEKDRPSRNNLL